MKPKLPKLIAVYGTLRKGFRNNRLFQGSELLGSLKTKPAFTMFSAGGFPFVAPFGDTPISIEVFKVEDGDILRRIYNLEGYSGKRDAKENWYNTIALETPWGEAEMFVNEKKNELLRLPVIKSGDWLLK